MADPMQFNQDPEWLRQKADAENDYDVTIGSQADFPSQPQLIMELPATESATADISPQLESYIKIWQDYLLAAANSYSKHDLPADTTLQECKYTFDELLFGLDYLMYRIRHNSNGIFIDLGIGINQTTHYCYHTCVDNHNKLCEWSKHSALNPCSICAPRQQ